MHTAEFSLQPCVPRHAHFSSYRALESVDACADSEDQLILVQTASGKNGSPEARKESGSVCYYTTTKDGWREAVDR